VSSQTNHSDSLIIPLESGKKIYFASDFHLGVPDAQSSREREAKIVRWLNAIETDAQAIFLVGDIFDFWFEHTFTIPKGYIRLQGKLAQMSDKGIPVIFFTGNHDMWMFDYFTQELNIPIYRQPQTFLIGQKKFLIGHGDGLGPGDRFYKILKKVFANSLAQWLFARLHPNLSMGIAQLWSRKSRLVNTKKGEDKFLGDQEWLLQYCRETEKTEHHDFYIFGHRHLPLDLQVGEKGRYINLGEWVNYCTYAVFDGGSVALHTFEKELTE
jgi:UDP-2,3-diacylglucosamine hydrolase